MAISAALGSAALLPAGLGFRNVIINGNFDVWQRGQTFSTDNGATRIYTADRWCARALFPNSGAVQVITRDTANVPAGSQYALKSVIGTAAVVNNSRMQLAYTIENADAVKLAGKQMVLTLQAKSIQNIDRITIQPTYNTAGGNVYDGTAISTTNFTVNTSSFTTCTLFFTVPAIATLTSAGSLGFIMSYTRSSGALEQVGDGIYLSQVQLEQNYQPTPFEQRPYGVELALCQRYYYLLCEGNVKAIALVGYISSARALGPVFFPVTMRTAPTQFVVSGTNYYYAYSSGQDDFNDFTLSGANPNVAHIDISANLAGTTGYAAHVTTNNAAARVAFGAEL